MSLIDLGMLGFFLFEAFVENVGKRDNFNVIYYLSLSTFFVTNVTRFRDLDMPECKRLQ
jgi:hypothetical protein